MAALALFERLNVNLCDACGCYMYTMCGCTCALASERTISHPEARCQVSTHFISSQPEEEEVECPSAQRLESGLPNITGC